MWKPILIIIIIFLGASICFYFCIKPTLTEISYQQIFFEKPPQQLEILNKTPINYQKGAHDFQIHPLYKYILSGRVLSKKRYTRGWNSKLSKYDLAIGWGDMAKLEILKKIKIKQILRFFTYRYNYDFPLTPEYINTHSSNNHIIAASKNIEKVLWLLKKKDIVRISGFLVNITGKYKERNVVWKTSTERDDSGDGACEIIYVTEIQINEKIYR